MPFLLKIAPLGTGLSSFSALGNGGRHAASTFCYHSELNSIISFEKYPLLERALRASDWFSKGRRFEPQLRRFFTPKNGGRHAASTFCYHSELNSIISFGKYPLFDHQLEKILHSFISVITVKSI